MDQNNFSDIICSPRYYNEPIVEEAHEEFELADRLRNKP